MVQVVVLVLVVVVLVVVLLVVVVFVVVVVLVVVVVKQRESRTSPLYMLYDSNKMNRRKDKQKNSQLGGKCPDVLGMPRSAAPQNHVFSNRKHCCSVGNPYAKGLYDTFCPKHMQE